VASEPGGGIAPQKKCREGIAPREKFWEDKEKEGMRHEKGTNCWVNVEYALCIDAQHNILLGYVLICSERDRWKYYSVRAVYTYRIHRGDV